MPELYVYELCICEPSFELKDLNTFYTRFVVAPDMSSAINEVVSVRTTSVEVVSQHSVTIAPF